MIRLTILAAVTAVLASCAQVTQLVTPSDDEVVVRLDAPSGMFVSIPRLNARGSVSPVASNDGVTTWATSDNTTFSFRQGVIVSTRGVGDDLMGADVRQTLAALRGGATDWAPRIYSFMNGEYQAYFTTFQCRRTGTRSEAVTVGDRSLSAQRTDETCVNDEQQIENTYWRNSNGTMIKSRQWVSNGVGYMETERVGF